MGTRRHISKPVDEVSFSVPTDVPEVGESMSRLVDLLQKETLFANILNHTSDVLTVYRIKGEGYVLEAFNRAAREGRGLGGLEAAIGRDLSELTEADQYAEIIKKFRVCSQGGAVTSFEERVSSVKGARYFLTTLVPIRSSEGVVERVASLARDITGHKRIERELRREKAKADMANQAKTDFLATMSHELRTPLNVILGMCQLLSHAEEITPEHAEFLDSIYRSGKLLRDLIQDVLDLSKIEAGVVRLESRPLSMDRLTGEVLSSFEAQAERKGLVLKRVFPQGKDFWVEGDETRLRQVLINFLGNAIKFTERGTVELEVIPLRSSTSESAHLRFEVRDTGVGIPVSGFQKVFQRFSQVDSSSARRYGGTGLGLVICKQIVELMRGEIGFSSEENRGSKFWFSVNLNVVADEREVAAPIVRRTPRPRENGTTREGLRILVVDDSQDNLSLLRALLPKMGHEAVLVESGAAALDKLRLDPSIQLVLMDVQMPGMDGYEVTHRIRALEAPTNQVPIIAVTANALTGDREMAMNAGMNDYITKPYDFGELRRVLAGWSARPARSS